MQRVLYREWAYIFGLLTMGLGAACMEYAGFGMSMVVAPAYIIHVKIAEFWPLFSFGVAEWVFQLFLLVLLCLVIRRFKVSYLFSFATAVIYGIVLDSMMALVHLLPHTLLVRAILYVLGMVITSAGVAFFFRTYLAPEVYELFVKLVAEKHKLAIHRVKLVYDIGSCLLGALLSLALFGFKTLVGVGWGTVVCALINGHIIGFFTKLYDRLWRYEDRFPALRRLMPEHTA